MGVATRTCHPATRLNHRLTTSAWRRRRRCRRSTCPIWILPTITDTSITTTGITCRSNTSSSRRRSIRGRRLFRRRRCLRPWTRAFNNRPCPTMCWPSTRRTSRLCRRLSLPCRRRPAATRVRLLRALCRMELRLRRKEEAGRLCRLHLLTSRPWERPPSRGRVLNSPRRWWATAAPPTTRECPSTTNSTTRRRLIRTWILPLPSMLCIRRKPILLPRRNLLDSGAPLRLTRPLIGRKECPALPIPTCLLYHLHTLNTRKAFTFKCQFFLQFGRCCVRVISFKMFLICPCSFCCKYYHFFFLFANQANWLDMLTFKLITVPVNHRLPASIVCLFFFHRLLFPIVCCTLCPTPWRACKLVMWSPDFSDATFFSPCQLNLVFSCNSHPKRLLL